MYAHTIVAAVSTHPHTLTPSHPHTLTPHRLGVIGLISPIITHIGYSINWRQVTVITWGGLRGAVGLSLALVVAQTPGVPFDTIGSKVQRFGASFLNCFNW